MVFSTEIYKNEKGIKMVNISTESNTKYKIKIFLLRTSQNSLTFFFNFRSPFE